MSMHFVVSCLQYVKWNIIYTNIILARSFINILYSFCVMADNKISMALYLLFYSAILHSLPQLTFFLLKSVVVSQIKLSSASKPCAADRVFIIRVLCLAHAEMLIKHKTNRVLIQWCCMIVILPIMKASRIR